MPEDTNSNSDTRADHSCRRDTSTLRLPMPTAECRGRGPQALLPMQLMTPTCTQSLWLQMPQHMLKRASKARSTITYDSVNWQKAPCRDMCVLTLKQVTKMAAAKQIGRLALSRRTGAATIQLGDHRAASTHLCQETEDRAIRHLATRRDAKGLSRIGHNIKQHSRKLLEASQNSLILHKI